MVPLVTVANAFQARVVAARLGSVGVLAQLRGGDGPYPLGDVRVEVPDDELDFARQLLLADEVEAAFAPAPDEPPVHRRRWITASVVVGAAVAAEAAALAARFS